MEINMFMDKFLKNPLVLGFILFCFDILQNILLKSPILYFLKVLIGPSLYLSPSYFFAYRVTILLIYLLASIALGWIYSAYFKQIMSLPLRLGTAICHALIFQGIYSFLSTYAGKLPFAAYYIGRFPISLLREPISKLPDWLFISVILFVTILINSFCMKVGSMLYCRNQKC